MADRDLTKEQIITKLKELGVPHDREANKEDLAKLLPSPPNQPQQGDRMQPGSRRVRENVVTTKNVSFQIGQLVSDDEAKAAELEEKYLDA